MMSTGPTGTAPPEVTGPPAAADHHATITVLTVVPAADRIPAARIAVVRRAAGNARQTAGQIRTTPIAATRTVLNAQQTAGARGERAARAAVTRQVTAIAATRTAAPEEAAHARAEVPGQKGSTLARLRKEGRATVTAARMPALRAPYRTKTGVGPKAATPGSGAITIQATAIAVTRTAAPEEAAHARAEVPGQKGSIRARLLKEGHATATAARMPALGGRNKAKTSVGPKAATPGSGAVTITQPRIHTNGRTTGLEERPKRTMPIPRNRKDGL